MNGESAAHRTERGSGWAAYLEPAEPELAPCDLRAARRLGFVVAIVVAVAAALAGSTLNTTVAYPWIFAEDPLALPLAVLAAAPIGWLLGPRVARSSLRTTIGIAVAMACETMLLGDVLVVLIGILGAETSQPGVAWWSSLMAVPVLALIGAIVVGPFVVVLVTLPAALVWVGLFRLAWCRSHPYRDR